MFATGCQDHGKSIAFIVGYGDTSGWTDEHKDFVGLAKSPEELQILCTNNEYGFFDESKSDFKTNLGSRIRNYDNEFFTQNALVLYLFSEGSHDPNGKIEVKTISVKDEVLTLNLKRTRSGYANDVMTAWAFIVEVNRLDVADVIMSKVHLS